MAKQSKPKVKVSRDKGLHERIVFLTDADQARRIAEYSEVSGVPVAVMLRRAADEYLNRVAPKK
jgi:hypothetical protein